MLSSRGLFWGDLLSPGRSQLGWQEAVGSPMGGVGTGTWKALGRGCRERSAGPMERSGAGRASCAWFAEGKQLTARCSALCRILKTMESVDLKNKHSVILAAKVDFGTSQELQFGSQQAIAKDIGKSHKQRGMVTL